MTQPFPFSSLPSFTSRSRALASCALMLLLHACGDSSGVFQDRQDSGTLPTDAAPGHQDGSPSRRRVLPEKPAGRDGADLDGGASDLDAGVEPDARAEDDAGLDEPSDLDGSPLDAPLAEAPNVLSAGFEAYGLVRVKLDGPVVAAELSADMEPVRPSGLSVVDIEQVAEDAIVVRLNAHHLPIDYTLRLVHGGAGWSRSVGLSGLGNGSRAAFLTQAVVTGDVVASVGLADLSEPHAAADALCRHEADAAGLRGVFRAYLGHLEGESRVDPVCTLRGEPAGCMDVAIPSPEEAPFINPVGMPVVLGSTGIAANEWLAPIGYTADGDALDEPRYVFTGATHTGGAQTTDCAGWTSDSAGLRGVGAALPDDLLLRPSHSLPCDTGYHLVCMQTEGGFFGESDLHRREGREVFVTSDTYPAAFAPPDAGAGAGLAQADLQCQQAAQSAGLTAPEQFVAWLSDDTEDAICRLVGQGGKRGDDACGLGSWPEAGPWVRADGVVVAPHITDLIDTPRLDAPVLLDPTGARTAGRYVWTSTGEDGAGSPHHCQNWTTTNAGLTARGGNVQATRRTWTFYFASACSGEHHLLCMRGL